MLRNSNAQPVLCFTSLSDACLPEIWRLKRRTAAAVRVSNARCGRPAPASGWSAWSVPVRRHSDTPRQFGRPAAVFDRYLTAVSGRRSLFLRQRWSAPRRRQRWRTFLQRPATTTAATRQRSRKWPPPTPLPLGRRRRLAILPPAGRPAALASQRAWINSGRHGWLTEGLTDRRLAYPVQCRTAAAPRPPLALPSSPLLLLLPLRQRQHCSMTTMLRRDSTAELNCVIFDRRCFVAALPFCARLLSFRFYSV